MRFPNELSKNLRSMLTEPDTDYHRRLIGIYMELDTNGKNAKYFKIDEKGKQKAIKHHQDALAKLLDMD